MNRRVVAARERGTPISVASVSSAMPIEQDGRRRASRSRGRWRRAEAAATATTTAAAGSGSRGRPVGVYVIKDGQVSLATPTI